MSLIPKVKMSTRKGCPHWPYFLCFNCKDCLRAQQLYQFMKYLFKLLYLLYFLTAPQDEYLYMRVQWLRELWFMDREAQQLFKKERYRYYYIHKACVVASSSLWPYARTGSGSDMLCHYLYGTPHNHMGLKSYRSMLYYRLSLSKRENLS